MEGAEALTQEIDIYAFAICCGEILTMGSLPWPLMDDDAVRRLVLSGYPLLTLLDRLRFCGSHVDTLLPSRMFYQMRTRGPRSRRRLISLTTSSWTSSARAGTASRRNGRRSSKLQVRSRGCAQCGALRTSTCRRWIARGRWPRQTGFCRSSYMPWDTYEFKKKEANTIAGWDMYH